MTVLTRESVSARHRMPTPRPQEVAAAAEAFRHADAAAEESRANLSRAQAAGVEELPPGVEFLFAEAQARAEEFAAVSGIPLSSLGYESRPRVSGGVVSLSTDWRESIGLVDWSKGRGAA